MAATLIGATATFGLTAEVGGVVQSSRFRESHNEVTLADEDGDITGAVFHGGTNEITQEIIVVSGTGNVAAALGAQISFANHTGLTGTTRLMERETSLSNSGYKTVSITGKNYPAIATT